MLKGSKHSRDDAEGRAAKTEATERELAEAFFASPGFAKAMIQQARLCGGILAATPVQTEMCAFPESACCVVIIPSLDSHAQLSN